MTPRYRVKAPSRPLLTVVPFEQPKAEGVLNILRRLIEMAEAGEIKSVAVAAARYDGGITTAYHTGSGLFPLLGAVAAVDTRLRKEVDS